MSSVYGLTGSFATAANTANQYLFGVVGTATVDGRAVWLDVTFDNATSAQGIQIQLFRATGGIPTLTSYTPNRMTAGSQNAASQTTAWITPVTVTPSGLTVIRTWYYNPAGGAMMQWPLSREDYLIPAANSWMGARISTPASVSPNCAYNFAWEE